WSVPTRRERRSSYRPRANFTSAPASPIRQAAIATYWIVASVLLGASSAERISQPMSTSPTALKTADFRGDIGASPVLRRPEWSGFPGRRQAGARRAGDASSAKPLAFAALRSYIGGIDLADGLCYPRLPALPTILLF